jgi:biopolymer transport protein TolR
MGLSIHSSSDRGVQSDINVTPLIDVMLVLLIIFLVVMPNVLRVEPLVVPPKVDGGVPGPQISLTVRSDLTIDFDDGMGGPSVAIEPTELARTLRPKLDALHGTDKVVFVDFEDPVPWQLAVQTMDSIRSLANDVEHDEIKVALKIRDEDASPHTSGKLPR